MIGEFHVIKRLTMEELKRTKYDLMRATERIMWLELIDEVFLNREVANVQMDAEFSYIRYEDYLEFTLRANVTGIAPKND